MTESKLLHHSLEDLAATIANARRDIAAIQPDTIKTAHIKPSHDELDAIVGATEDATNKIMDQCDVITALAASCGENGTQMTQCVTRIFEACNFQDLTGQRIKKVVGALKQIDQKVDALLKALGAETASAPALANDKTQLLNGPQLPDAAPTQNDIDKMFGS